MPYQGSPGGRGREEASGRSLAYHGTALAGGSALHGNPGPSSPEVSAQSSTVSNLIRELQEQAGGSVLYGSPGRSPPPSVVSAQSSTVSNLIRELQEQGRDHGPIPTPRPVGAVTISTPLSTPRGSNRRLSDLLATAGMDVRDDQMVASDTGAGSGFVDFFVQSLRAEDQMLRQVESGVVTSAVRADSLYSTAQIQVAGLEEENSALAEKVTELHLHNESLRARLQQGAERNLALERENARLHEVNRGLETFNDALQGQMHSESEDLKAEIALLQATAKAQKQEMELQRTRLEQELRLVKGLESVQQYQARLSEEERLAEEGLAYKRNYDVVYAQAQMLQERVWSLEKDLLESQQRMASEDALLETAYHKEEAVRISRELMEVQADCESQKLKLMERLNEARSLLERELEKNTELEYFKTQCERISGIDMTKLCSMQELNLAQQLLLAERAQSTRGKYMAIWAARYRRKKGMQRARMWLVSRLQRRQKLHVLQFIRQMALHRKRLDQILFTFEYRKSRKLQRVVVLQWARVVRTTRAFNAAANALLERSDRALAQDSLLLWQRVVTRGKLASEHVKSAQLRRSFRAATAAMSSLDVEDLQDFLPTMAPEVYGGNVNRIEEAPKNVFDVVICANARRHLRGLRLSVLLEWHRVAEVSRKLNYYCLLLMNRRDIRAPVISEWHRAAVECRRLKRCCLQIVLRLDDSILKKMFDEWRTIWVASANVGRMSASRAAVIKQAAQDILPPWMHAHIDRALTDAMPEDQRTSASQNMVSIAVQVERKQGDEDMEILLDKYSGVLSAFVDRKTLNIPFAVWSQYVSKKRKQEEKCRRALVARRHRSLQGVLHCWQDEVLEFEMSIARPMELWLSKVFCRDTYSWAFSTWSSYCKQRSQGPEKSARDRVTEEMYDAPITLSTKVVSPQRMGATPPRVMGMSPPPAKYESPRTMQTDMGLSGRDHHEPTEKIFEVEDIMMELVLDMEMEQLDGIEEEFKALLIIDIAQAVFGKPDKIKIHEIQAGSVIVTFALQEGVCDDGRSLSAVAKDLEVQIGDSQSKLKQGRYTSQAISAKILTQNSSAASMSAVNEVFARILCQEPLAPRRVRHVIMRWSQSVIRQRNIRRRVQLFLQRSRRNDAGTLEVCFKSWWQRKCDVEVLTDRAIKTRKSIVLKHFVADWWTFLQQSWQLRKTATILYHREARGIMRKWKTHTDKHRRISRILTVLAMRTDRGNALASFKAWRRRLHEVQKMFDISYSFEQKRLGHVFGAWKGLLLRFRQGQTITHTYRRFRDNALLRSSFRSWFCNAHVVLHLRNGFQDQVFAMSTVFLSDMRTQRLQNELSCLQGRRRALKACKVFAKEIGLTVVQKKERDAFESWQAFCDWRSSGREFYLRVENLSDSKMVQKYLFAWARGIQQQKRNADVIMRILLRWNRSLRWQILSAWNLYTRMRSEVSHKISSFCGRANRRVKQKVLKDWKTLSDFEEMLLHIAEVMDGKVLRRACYAWHQRLVEENLRRKKVWRATLVIRRSTLKAVLSKWHSQAVKQIVRNKAVVQMLHSVLKGKLWVATMSWRNHTRIIASGKSRAAWLCTQYVGSVVHRAFWTWSQFCRNSRDAEFILVRAQGRRMTQTAEEALERTTLLEWLYRQQFKALFRVRLQRAAVLVQRRRLRLVVQAWRCSVEDKNEHGKIVFALGFKRDSVLRVLHFRMWIAYKFKADVLRERKETLGLRLRMRTIRKFFSLLRSEMRRKTRQPTSFQIHTRLADKSILINLANLKRAMWMRWTFAIQSRRVEVVNLRRAAALLRKHRTRALLKVWHENVQTTVRCKNLLRHMLNESKHAALYRCFVAWAEYVQSRRVEVVNLRRAAALLRKHSTRALLKVWHENVQTTVRCKNLLRHMLNESKHAALYRCFVAWAEYVQHRKIERRNAERGAIVWYRRALRQSIGVWRESARVAKNSKHILRTLKNRLQHASIFSAYSKWAKYVEWTSQSGIKMETTLWMRLAATQVTRNDSILAKTLQTWKNREERFKAFLHSTSVGAVFKMNYAALNTVFKGWDDVVCERRQNRFKVLRLEQMRRRNLLCSMFSTWLLLLEEITELEFHASRWEDWRGPVPEWYAESLLAVIQQRMTTAARIMRAWNKLVDQYNFIVAMFRQKIGERWSRCLFVRWQHLKDYKRMIKLDSLNKEECISRRAFLNLLRDSVRVWVAYTRKYSALRMGNMCADRCFLERRALAFGRTLQYPRPMQRRMAPRPSTFVRRCGGLLYGRDANVLSDILVEWKLRSGTKIRRLRICQTLLQSGQYTLVRRMFTGFKSYCSRQVYHSHHLNRLNDIFSASLHRRFTHRQIAQWHLAAELQESRTDRLNLTLKILVRKARKETETRVLATLIAYRDHKHRLRACEYHVMIRTHIWLKRRLFRSWKDVEWLKYFSQILERWYKLSMGQILQVMQRRALKSVSEMWDRTSLSILADMQKPMSDDMSSDATDPFAKENRAVQFQDPLHQALPTPPSSMIQTQDVKTTSARGRSESPKRRGSRKKSKTPPKLEAEKRSEKQGEREKLKSVARVVRSASAIARSSQSTNVLTSPRQTASSLLRTGASRSKVAGSTPRGSASSLPKR